MYSVHVRSVCAHPRTPTHTMYICTLVPCKFVYGYESLHHFIIQKMDIMSITCIQKMEKQRSGTRALDKKLALSCRLVFYM